MAKKQPVTYKAPTPYVAPQYDEKKYTAGIDTSWYTNEANRYAAQANKERAQQIGQAGKERDTGLKSAYITRVQNERQLRDNMATAGIRGGATETSGLRLANEYGNAVGQANANFTNSVNSINQSIDKNIADYRADMSSRAQEYKQNMAQARWQADREASLTQYNAAREDSLNEYNAANEFWNNYYTDYYSGWGKKNLKKALKLAKKKYKAATSQKARIQQLQRIRGIRARMGQVKAEEAAKK